MQTNQQLRNINRKRKKNKKNQQNQCRYYLQISRLSLLQSRVAKSKHGLVNKGMYLHLLFSKRVSMCVGREQIRESAHLSHQGHLHCGSARSPPLIHLPFHLLRYLCAKTERMNVGKPSADCPQKILHSLMAKSFRLFCRLA